MAEMDKKQWRARLAAQRAEISMQQQVAEAQTLGEHVAALRRELEVATACCYVPFGSEPGSIGMLDTLRAAGTRVLLPVIPDEPGPLDWAVYDGPSSLAPGRFKGVLEPTGTRLGPSGIGQAELVLIPALAVDERGARLGRGAGYYDRSLGRARSGAELAAVIRDTELVRELPSEAHDVVMTSVLTPTRGLIRLPLPAQRA